MVYLFIYSGNVRKHCNQIPLHANYDVGNRKQLATPRTGRDLEQMELSYTVNRTVKVYSTLRQQLHS